MKYKPVRPVISKELTCQLKSTMHPNPQKIRVLANSQREFNKLIRDLKVSYIVK